MDWLLIIKTLDTHPGDIDGASGARFHNIRFTTKKAALKAAEWASTVDPVSRSIIIWDTYGG
jgi:hypothetical protein